MPDPRRDMWVMCATCSRTCLVRWIHILCWAFSYLVYSYSYYALACSEQLNGGEGLKLMNSICHCVALTETGKNLAKPSSRKVFCSSLSSTLAYVNCILYTRKHIYVEVDLRLVVDSCIILYKVLWRRVTYDMGTFSVQYIVCNVYLFG